MDGMVKTAIKESQKTEIGRRLEEARKIRGMSRAALAEALSRLEGSDTPSGQSRISNYEYGYNEPGGTTVRLLCEILGCSADWLLGREDNDFDSRFEKVREVYAHTDERGREGIWRYAESQPIVKTDRDDAGNG